MYNTSKTHIQRKEEMNGLLLVNWKIHIIWGMWNSGLNLQIQNIIKYIIWYTNLINILVLHWIFWKLGVVAQ